MGIQACFSGLCFSGGELGVFVLVLGVEQTHGYFSRASDMMERECRHCACTFRSLSVGTSS